VLVRCRLQALLARTLLLNGQLWAQGLDTVALWSSPWSGLLCAAQVVEQGSHAQLIERGGQYCSMWSRQQDYSIPPSPSPDLGLAAAAPAAARLPRDKSFGASLLPGEVSRGVKGPLKLLLRQPEDGEDQPAGEQQQHGGLAESPADSAAATAAGDGDADSGVGVDSLGELAAASGRGSSCSGGGEAADDEGGGVRRLADSSASIRRYHMLRRAETGELGLLLLVLMLLQAWGSAVCADCTCMYACSGEACQGGLLWLRSSRELRWYAATNIA
jgi:hypothetical protein